MDKVIFVEEELASGKFLARVRLSRPQALNVLDLEMAVVFRQKLLQWRDRKEIVAIFLEGAGDRAFCAGGDVKSLYYHMREGHYDKVDEFFQAEYALDQEIHNFSKPIIVWGDGIVMGGGIGLFAGASHRVVTERTVMAMPEVSIGFFPDVGASYFLNQMPNHIGLFLGITGARFSGHDGVALGLGDFLISSENKKEFLKQFTSLDWQNVLDEKEVKDQTSKILQGLAQKVSKSEFIQQIRETQSLEWKQSLSSFIENLEKVAEKQGSLLSQAWSNLKNSSPLAVKVSWQQLQKSRRLSLKEAFVTEFSLASKLARYGDFQEGVRALLVDKDKSPKWKYKRLEDMNDQDVQIFFNMG